MDLEKISEDNNKIDDLLKVDENIKNDVSNNTAKIENISSNLGKINTNKDDISSNLGIINTNKDNITSNLGKINTNKNDVSSNLGIINTNKNDISFNLNQINNIKSVLPTLEIFKKTYSIKNQLFNPFTAEVHIWTWYSKLYFKKFMICMWELIVLICFV